MHVNFKLRNILFMYAIVQMAYTITNIDDPQGFENNFNVFLRTLNNTTVLNLSSDTSVRNLKYMIEKMTYINVEDQLVSFN